MKTGNGEAARKSGHETVHNSRLRPVCRQISMKGTIMDKFYYVYMLQSILNENRYYVGMTNNLKRRLKEHNNGKSTYTKKLKPWKLITYIGFNSRIKALHFETYLKSHSGRTFAKKHF